MSGAFGWHQHDTTTTGSVRQADDPFSQAAKAYKAPAAPSTRTRIVDPVQPPTPSRVLPSTVTRTVPGAKGTLRSTAANVLVVSMDVTGSMGEWPAEIFKRLPLLYHEACEYLGSDDLEILFLAHGDAGGDRNPLQVARFGRGQELDDILASFDVARGGLGNGHESHELVLYKLVRDVDTSSAVNAHLFFLTDEPARDVLDDSEVRSVFGKPIEGELRSTPALARELLRRMNVWTVLCATGTYDPAPIRNWWERLLGPERVLPLDDHRRVVDVILATLAKQTGQLDQFAQKLRSRQAGSLYADQNVRTVMASVALVGTRGPNAPRMIAGPGTKSLLPGKKD